MHAAGRVRAKNTKKSKTKMNTKKYAHPKHTT